MTEQRNQAYIEIIKRLVSCDAGEEVEILEANQNLVDEGFIGMLLEAASSLKVQERVKMAERLYQIATVLESSLQASIENQDSLRRSYFFLLEAFQHIYSNALFKDYDSIINLIRQYLLSNKEKLNPNLLEVFPRVITKFLEISTSAQEKYALSIILNLFGMAIQGIPIGINQSNIEIAILAYNQSLYLITKEAMPGEWVSAMNNLAAAYFSRTGESRAENIEQAIQANNEVLTVATKSSMPHVWAATMSNLANSYNFRVVGSRSENIEKAIEVCQKALTVRTKYKMPCEWVQSMNNLGCSHFARIEGDREQNIERTIEIYCEVLTVATEKTMPVDWAKAIMNMATAYNSRVFGDRTENIEKAINGYKRALEVITKEEMPTEWAGIMNNLGGAYQHRIRGDRVENIEEAIDAYEQALTVTTREVMPIEWSQTMMNIGIAYKFRLRGENSENIEKAIEASQQALSIIDRDKMPIEWSQTMMNMGNAYTSRIRGQVSENIENAIYAHEQALTFRPKEQMPEKWALAMLNLGYAYQLRRKGELKENIEEAISIYKNILSNVEKEALPHIWAMAVNNLAVVYAVRLKGQRTDNLKEAIELCEQALEIFQAEQFPNDCRRVAMFLGQLYSEKEEWDRSATAYQKAIDATNILYQASIFLNTQKVELSGAGGLFRKAAYARAKAGDLEVALVTVEQGRARSLSDALERDRKELDSLKRESPGLYNQYKKIVEEIKQIEIDERSSISSNISERPRLSQALLRRKSEAIRERFKEVISKIKSSSKQKDFLAQSHIEDIADAVQKNVPLVYIIPSHQGGLALIAHKVMSDNENIQFRIAPVWLDKLSDSSLEELLNSTDSIELGWLKAYRNRDKSWSKTISRVTRELWDLAVGSITERIESLEVKEAVLIAGSYLGFLPLHAAWKEDNNAPTDRHYALDTVNFTYAPNAKSITANQVIAKHVSANSILAIDNPRQDLPNSYREVSAAVSSFSTHSILNSSKATTAAVKSYLVESEIAHFSCHGTANLTNPLNSGLLMHDGLLTLKDIFALNLAENDGLRLVILSACETGLSGFENADEAISLPTGLIQGGAAAVIASLWSVSDLSTMILLTRFYDFWRTEGLEISQALRYAQQWVRDTENQQKYDYLKVTFQKLVDIQRMSKQEVDELLRSFLLQYIYSDGPQARSFAHPFHWAAFTYVGV